MPKKVISATVTPLLENGSLDKTGLKNILERNISHGLDGVFLFGSMGEWGSFSNCSVLWANGAVFPTRSRKKLLNSSAAG